MFTVQYNVAGGPDALEDTFVRFVPDAQIEFVVDNDQFKWSGRIASANERVLWRARSSADWSFRTKNGNHGFVSIIIPESGAVSVHQPGRDFHIQQNQALILYAPAERRLVTHRGDREHARSTFKWTLQEAQQAISSIAGNVSLEECELHPVLDLTDMRGQVVMRLLSAIAIDLAHTTPLSPLASQLMNEAALRLLFEPTGMRHEDRFGRKTWRIMPRHVKQAIEYMRANADKPLRIRDIADHCHVTPRSLENGFRTFMDTTPLAYLRALRLEGVRQELRTAERPERISLIARRWGFVDLGRFAERYRMQFGELPSDTKRKR